MPLSLTWLPIRRNLIVEDETTLRHIPYIHDDDPEAGTFIEELNEYYDDNMIVGGDDGDGNATDFKGFDDDEVLNEVLVELAYSTARLLADVNIGERNSMNGSVPSKKVTDSLTGGKELDEMVWVLLSQVIPGDREATNLREHFKALLGRTHQKAVAPDAQASLCPDADSPVANVSAARLLDSYHT